MSDTLVMTDVVVADPTGLASPSLYLLPILSIPRFLPIFLLKLSPFPMRFLLLLHPRIHSHLHPLMRPPTRSVMAALPIRPRNWALRNKPRPWLPCALASPIVRSLASTASPTRPSIA